MPPRLAHRKSRSGCRRCKERKVKCSEDRPSCGACLRHGVICEYGDAPTPMNRPVAESTPPPSQQRPTSNIGTARATNIPTPTSGGRQTPLNGPETPYSDIVSSLILSEPRRHVIELFLLHRFTSTVATTFPSARDESMKFMYILQAPNLACDNRFLFDAIFAVTALYIWKTVDPRKSGYTEQSQLPETFRGVDFAQLHRIYLNQAIQQQREAFASLGPSNSDAVGLTSIMLAIMATCLLPESEASGEAEYSPPIQWLRMAGSIGTVFQAAFPHVREGSIMMTYFLPDRKPNLSDSDYLYKPSNTRPFQQVLDFQKHINVSVDVMLRRDPLETDPVYKETYRITLALIGSIYIAIRNGEPPHYICQRVVAFGSLCPRLFIEMISDSKPRAMVILAHYMAMIKHIDDDFWWFKGRAEKEILGIQSILPQEWQWGLKWPLAVLESPLKAKLDAETFNPIALDDTGALA